MSRWQSWTALDRRVWQMAFARSINTAGLSLVMSFLGIYVVDTRGYPMWLYGVIALIANLGQSLSSAWAGNLSDRIGRKPLITTSLILRSAVIAALGTQVLLDAPLWSLAINMVVSSTLRGGFEPVSYALVADVAKDHERIAAFGLQRMSTNVGWAFGPALGGVLTLVMPYGAVFYIAAAGMVAAALVAMRVVDPIARTTAPAPARGELRFALRESAGDPLLRVLLAGTFLCALLQTQMFATFGVFMTKELGLTQADVGLLYTVNGAGVLLLQVPAIAFLERHGIGRLLPWASLFSAVGFAMIGAAFGFGGAAVAIFVVTGAEVLFGPAHQAAIAECGDPEKRGRTYGVVAFVQMIGIALAPLLGGVLFDTIGHDHVAMWLTIATIGLLQTLCFLAFVRRRAGIQSAREGDRDLFAGRVRG
jgi:MFS family permease